MASRAPAHADVERVGGVGEVPCLLHVGFGLFFGLFAFVFGQPLVKPCLEPVGERLFRPDGLRGFLRGLWRRFTSREDLKTTVTKALEHNVRTSDGMNWNLHDLVYEALSEEWGRRDGEISDLWADDGPSGYQPPSYEPVNPERRTPQTPSDGLI